MTYEEKREMARRAIEDLTWPPPSRDKDLIKRQVIDYLRSNDQELVLATIAEIGADLVSRVRFSH